MAEKFNNDFLKIGLYGVVNKDTDELHNIVLSFDDKSACEWFVGQLRESIKSVPEDKENMFKMHVDSSSFNRIGYLDRITHDFVKDENVLLFLNYDELKELNEKEKEKENESKQ